MMTAQQDFIDFIQQSPSPAHVTRTGGELLKCAEFREINFAESMTLVPGGKYYGTIYDTTLVAFTVGKKGGQLRMAAAHTDFPCLRLKPQPIIVRDGYISLNIESYGGIILRSWLDRPLSLAGKVALVGQDAFHPKICLIDFVNPVAVVPSLAIHFDRDVNDKGALNCQTDLLPLAGLSALDSDNDTKAMSDYFLSFLAKRLQCTTTDILAYELSFYPINPSMPAGFNDELFVSPRLDNLTSVWALLKAMEQSEPREGIRLIALFDHEEVGSRTKQGAGSTLLWHALSNIYHALNYSEEDLLRDIAQGFMLSVDVAHGTHPNHADKTDPTVKPRLGGGVVFKESAAQSYAGDAAAVATVKALATKFDIPWQEFVNRADQKGGSTLGSIASAIVPVRTMDIGAPILAMHSAAETMAWCDQIALNDFVTGFMEA